MKAFVCAIVIFIIMLTGTTIYIHVLDSTVYRLEEQVTAMADCAAISDWPACKQSFAAFCEDWNRVYPRLEFFIHHKTIEQINQLLYEIEGYTEVESREEFLVKSGVLQKMIHHLPTGERITAENIL